MAKSNYVGVVFSNDDDAKEYIYRVPEYVNIDDADHERWVLVEDAFAEQLVALKRCLIFIIHEQINLAVGRVVYSHNTFGCRYFNRERFVSVKL